MSVLVERSNLELYAPTVWTNVYSDGNGLEVQGADEVRSFADISTDPSKLLNIILSDSTASFLSDDARPSSYSWYTWSHGVVTVDWYYELYGIPYFVTCLEANIEPKPVPGCTPASTMGQKFSMDSLGFLFLLVIPGLFIAFKKYST